MQGFEIVIRRHGRRFPGTSWPGRGIGALLEGGYSRRIAGIGANPPLQPTSAFSRFPPVHAADYEAAKGRFDPFAKSSRNDRSLRKADGLASAERGNLMARMPPRAEPDRFASPSLQPFAPPLACRAGSALAPFKSVPFIAAETSPVIEIVIMPRRRPAYRERRQRAKPRTSPWPHRRAQRRQLCGPVLWRL